MSAPVPHFLTHSLLVVKIFKSLFHTFWRKIMLCRSKIFVFWWLFSSRSHLRVPRYSFKNSKSQEIWIIAILTDYSVLPENCLKKRLRTGTTGFSSALVQIFLVSADKMSAQNPIEWAHRIPSNERTESHRMLVLKLPARDTFRNADVWWNQAGPACGAIGYLA